MSNLSDDTLRKILQQIQTQAIGSQRELQIVRAQIQGKEKERKILELTMRELNTIPADEDKMFRGVGKMFIEQPRETIASRHKAQEATLAEDVTNLTKKAKYFEKKMEEANGQLRDIFHAQQREQQ